MNVIPPKLLFSEKMNRYKLLQPCKWSCPEVSWHHGHWPAMDDLAKKAEAQNLRSKNHTIIIWTSTTSSLSMWEKFWALSREKRKDIIFIIFFGHNEKAYLLHLIAIRKGKTTVFEENQADKHNWNSPQTWVQRCKNGTVSLVTYKEPVQQLISYGNPCSTTSSQSLLLPKTKKAMGLHQS